MKTCLVSLVVATLCIQAVTSLTCYTCIGQSSNRRCKIPNKCMASEIYCMTRVQYAGFSFFSTVYITKLCASICSPASDSLSMISSSTSCCQSDLCNVSAAAGVHLSALALLVPAAFVLSLLRAAL
ncbi:lymphocyte antigen 6E-like [Rhinatrema bivittatum]|uniref:lymphocyte antigen 6E-like n=1 Tax=Rhinatrema bivittatum TaxID=194408 RepID=UPI001128C8ED|nr:lymphocyte antigen 6E-like [Rhinatrema bivittatum]